MTNSFNQICCVVSLNKVHAKPQPCYRSVNSPCVAAKPPDCYTTMMHLHLLKIRSKQEETHRTCLSLGYKFNARNTLQTSWDAATADRESCEKLSGTFHR